MVSQPLRKPVGRRNLLMGLWHVEWFRLMKLGSPRLPKLPYLKFLTNRVLIGMVVFFVLVGFWEFRWKPQYRPLYERGVSLYQAGRFPEALDQFQRAYGIAPNSLDVILMLG